MKVGNNTHVFFPLIYIIQFDSNEIEKPTTAADLKLKL